MGEAVRVCAVEAAASFRTTAECELAEMKSGPPGAPRDPKPEQGLFVSLSPFTERIQV